MKTGVIVCLATGKARPAAVAALSAVGLAGDASQFTCIHITGNSHSGAFLGD